MNNTITDRLVSFLAYLTVGIFSLIWIVYANVAKKHISGFLMFNLYQAIFISIVLAVFSLVYSIAINILSVVPFIGGLAKSLDVLINQTPMYFSFTITGFIVFCLIMYLSIISLTGKKPYVPVVSDIIKMNFGG